MFSRQTTFALAFACLATLSVTVAAKVAQADLHPAPSSVSPMAVIDLPRVVVTGKVNRPTVDAPVQ
jgi:hypothetical protein